MMTDGRLMAQSQLVWSKSKNWQPVFYIHDVNSCNEFIMMNMNIVQILVLALLLYYY